MIFAERLKCKPAVLYGHPSTFWKDRQRQLLDAPININEIKKLSDVVNYDSLHLTKLIINKTYDKLKDILQKEDDRLKFRRLRLKQLLDNEEEQYIQELVTKQEMEECNVCVEREMKLKKYKEEIEKEKAKECQKALEREKITKGMQCSKLDEIRLREMQKLQMMEKKNRELEEEQTDRMWHQVLIEDVYRKEELEKNNQLKLQQEMIQRRMMYDEQIASATRTRKETLEKERQKENRRLEKMKLKAQQDHFEAIKRKRDQQMENKKNYLEDYRNKLNRLESLRNQDYQIDNKTIEKDLEEFYKDKINQNMMMKKLQKEKEIFLENFEKEKHMAAEMDLKVDLFIQESTKINNEKCDELQNSQYLEKKKEKDKMAKDYKHYLEYKNRKAELQIEERKLKMERVRETSVNQLQSQMKFANEELKKQLEYRSKLDSQIENKNKNIMLEQAILKNKQKCFWEKPESFKEVMARKVDKSPGRISTNPIHPFARVLRKREKNDSEVTTYLPSLNHNKLSKNI